MGKKHIRAQVTGSVLRNAAGSALARTTLALVLTAVFSAVEDCVWPLLLPLLLVLFYRRSLVFEILLMVHIIESSLGSWNYFSRIDEYIILGGIPMRSLDHVSVLSLDHRVEAVLSINESFELDAITLAGSPVSAGEWKVSKCGGASLSSLLRICSVFFPLLQKEDVHHRQLSSVDFAPPSHR